MGMGLLDRPRSRFCRVPGLLGPFHVPESTPMGACTDLYAGKLVRRGDDWFVMGFLDTIDGEFVGELADPIPFDPTVELPLAASLPAPSETLSQAAAPVGFASRPADAAHGTKAVLMRRLSLEAIAEVQGDGR
jgi:hypothetical protein